MDVVLFALLSFIAAVVTLGTVCIILVILALWYTSHFAHTGEEYRYTGRYLKREWRGGWI